MMKDHFVVEEDDSSSQEDAQPVAANATSSESNPQPQPSKRTYGVAITLTAEERKKLKAKEKKKNQRKRKRHDKAIITGNAEPILAEHAEPPKAEEKQANGEDEDSDSNSDTDLSRVGSISESLKYFKEHGGLSGPPKKRVYGVALDPSEYPTQSGIFYFYYCAA